MNVGRTDRPAQTTESIETMHTFDTLDTAIIIAMVIVYILATGWLTVRSRSKTSSEFMVASRSMPAFVVGVLMMSEFIGAKSSVGTAQAAFESGIVVARFSQVALRAGRANRGLPST